MNSSLSKHFRSRKLNSFDENFNTHYSDAFFPRPEFLATRNTNITSTKFKQHYLKTQESQSKRHLFRKSKASQQKVRLLKKLRGICKQYEQTQQISQTMCQSINQVIVYGKDMQKFFFILKKLIFCENKDIISNLQQFGQGQKPPYNYLILKAVENKHHQLTGRTLDIESQIQQINKRIQQIDRQSKQKMLIMTIQHDNGVAALKVQHQAQVSQLNLKMAILKDTIQSHQRTLRKAGLAAPSIKFNKQKQNIQSKVSKQMKQLRNDSKQKQSQQQK